MIIGEGEVNCYIVIYFGDKKFEVRNLGVLFVVFFRVKLVGGEDEDFDFVWYFYVLINEDRLC